MGDEIEALRDQYEEAKSRLTQQRDTFKTFSDEGVAVIRVLVLLVTAPAAVLGVFNYSTLVELVRFTGSNTQIGMFLTYSVPAILVTGLAVTGLVLALVMHTLAAGFDARGITQFPNDRDQ